MSSKYTQMVRGPVPYNAPPEHEHRDAVQQTPHDTPLIVAYFRHLSAYLWIQAHPDVAYRMRKHPGVRAYKTIHMWLWVAFTIWLILGAIAKHG